jgi:hypothetical protein
MIRSVKLRHLIAGKVAPEITGEDIDGKAHKALRLSRQSRRAQFLGIVVRPLQSDGPQGK